MPKTEIKSVEFVGSYPEFTKLPKPDLPEFAFAGRSNVGKSSLINMLCRRKNLAHTSATPGKTQTINLYRVDDQWKLVDLPGYGYAKVSKSARRSWARLLEEYIVQRLSLVCTFVLVDVRLNPQKLDIDFLNFLGEKRIACAIVFTKADKTKKTEKLRNITAFETSLLDRWEELPPRFVTSSKKQIGREEILEFIGTILQTPS